jgi:predicted nuclease with TOPRIM domain
MAETTKLSVEKALEKLRGSDSLKSKNQQRDEKADALHEEIKRMRAQRSRLDQNPRKRD